MKLKLALFIGAISVNAIFAEVILPDILTPTKFIKPGAFSQELSYKLLGAPATADSYSILGLRGGVSPVVIQQAFKQLALRYHPDKLEQSADKRTMLKQQIQQLVNQSPELKRMVEEQKIDIASDAFALQMGSLIFNIIRHAYEDLMNLETFPTIIDDTQPTDKPLPESKLTIDILAPTQEIISIAIDNALTGIRNVDYGLRSTPTDRAILQGLVIALKNQINELTPEALLTKINNYRATYQKKPALTNEQLNNVRAIISNESAIGDLKNKLAGKLEQLSAKINELPK